MEFSAREDAAREENTESWDTVHVTPLTAERELTTITTSRCFVLHSAAGFGFPLTSSLHTATAAAAAAATPTDREAGSGGDADDAASTTLPALTTTTALSAQEAREGRRATATGSVKDAAEASSQHAEDSAFLGAGRNVIDFFGAYRHVRVIHNTVPCLIRCAAELGPLPQTNTAVPAAATTTTTAAASPNNPSNNNNTTTNTNYSIATTTNTFVSSATMTAATGSAPVGCGVPPLVPAATSSPPPPLMQVALRPVEQSSSSLMQTSYQSVPETSNINAAGAAPGSPLAPPPKEAVEPRASLSGASSGTTQQLQQLATAYARSAQRRASKASSRRSHTSSSTLPECVVFADPLEIVADAALSVVDVVFAAPVSVRGRGPVQFLNCSFGHRTAPQLYQLFAAQPASAALRRRQPNAKSSQAADSPGNVAGGGDDGGKTLAQASTGSAAATTARMGDAEGDVAPLNTTTGADVQSAERTAGNQEKNTPSSAPAGPSVKGSAEGVYANHRKADSNNSSDISGGVLGLQAGFALPTTMRVAAQRRRRLAAATNNNSNNNNATAATSVLSVCGEVSCTLSQCDLYGGSAGGALLCGDQSRVSVTDSSFEGPSITWAAVEVTDSAECSVQYTNIQQILGVGVLVTDGGRAIVDSSLIERCGIAGVVATDRGTVSLHNTGVEASISGVCVTLSGGAEAQMIGCGFTTRFPLPYRTVGLMYVEHLQRLGAFKSARAESLASLAQESMASAVEDPLLQHTLNADFESLMGLWLLHVGAANVAFPNSSQSLLLHDSAVAVVAECEFTCTMRLPSKSVTSSSSTGESAAHNGDYAGMEDNTSSSGSHANRSDGAVPSFTGLPAAAASALAVIFSSSGANLSGTNPRGLGGSTSHTVTPTTHPFLVSGASLPRRGNGLGDDAGVKREGTAHTARSPTTAAVTATEVGVATEDLPLPSGLLRNASRSSVVPPASAEGMFQSSQHRAASTTTLPNTAVAAAAAGLASPPPPLHTSNASSATAAAAAALTAPLPTPVRRTVAGLLSTYVMVREVFGDFLAEKRRQHAASVVDGEGANITAGHVGGAGHRMEDDDGDATSPHGVASREKTHTGLFLSLEPPSEWDEPAAAAAMVAVKATEHDATSLSSRRLQHLAHATMASLQLSLLQLGCLGALMSPNGGVYHIVVSQQAYLTLSSSVLRLALPPPLMVTLPAAWASAASSSNGNAGAFSSTIRTTAAPFAAVVLDYHEPPVTIDAGEEDSTEDAPTPYRLQQQQQRQQEQAEQQKRFCSIFTRSNVIRYECESVIDSQYTNTNNNTDSSPHQSTRIPNGGAAVNGSGGGGGGGGAAAGSVPDSRISSGSAALMRRDHVGGAAVVAAGSGEDGADVNTNNNESTDETEEGEDRDVDAAEGSSAVHSIFCGGISGHSTNNSSILKRRPPASGLEGDVVRAAAGGAATTAGVPRSSSQLPPRPSSASASAAQHPRVSATVNAMPTAPQPLPPPHSPSSGDTSSSNAVEFNTAAWGLVLVTPPATCHSAAMEMAVRVQAEHWCRVELTASRAPTTTLGDMSATSSSTAAGGTGKDGPLGVPTALSRSATGSAAQPVLSINSSLSTRTAGGSTSVGCPAPTVTPSRAPTGPSRDAALSCDNTLGGSEQRANASTTASHHHHNTITIDDDSQTTQVQHLGNIFLNVANQAELLSVTHPEHVCTTFSTFAHVMELPAAQDYPESAATSLLAPHGGPLPHSTAPDSPGNPAAPNTTTTMTAVAAVGGATAAPPVSPSAVHYAGNNATIDADDVDAPIPRERLLSEVSGAATPATLTSSHSSPTATTTTAAAHTAFPGSLLSERDMSRLHVNAAAQRQMLFDDVDAPPLLAAVAAAARDGAEDVSGAHSTLVPSADKTKVGGLSFSSTSSRPSNNSLPFPDRARKTSALPSPLIAAGQTTTTTTAAAAAGAAATMTDKTTSLSLSRDNTRDGSDDVRSVDVTNAGPGGAAATTLHSGHSSPRSNSRVALTASPTGAGVTAIFPLTHGAAIVAVQPPTPPELEIVEVDSVTFSSSSTSSHSSGSDENEGGRSSSGSSSPSPSPAGSRGRDKYAQPTPASVAGSGQAHVTAGPTQQPSSQPAAPPVLLQPPANYELDFVDVVSEGGSTRSSSTSISPSSSSSSSPQRSPWIGAQQRGTTPPQQQLQQQQQQQPRSPQPPPQLPAPPQQHAPGAGSRLSPSNTVLFGSTGPANPDAPLIACVAPYSLSSTTASAQTSTATPQKGEHRSEETQRTAAEAHAAAQAHPVKQQKKPGSGERHGEELQHPPRTSTEALRAAQTAESNNSSNKAADEEEEERRVRPPQQPLRQARDTRTETAETAKAEVQRADRPGSAVAAGAATASSPPPPVVDTATQERLAQLEEQLVQMQRLILLQQTQMTQMHFALQQSATSQMDSSAFDMQPSLLVLPSAGKSIADTSENTTGTSKDSRQAQSSSYRSSFNSSKLHSTSGSNKTSDHSSTAVKALLPTAGATLATTAAAAAVAAGGTTVVCLGGQEDRQAATTPVKLPQQQQQQQQQHAQPPHAAVAAGLPTSPPPQPPLLAPKPPLPATRPSHSPAAVASTVAEDSTRPPRPTSPGTATTTNTTTTTTTSTLAATAAALNSSDSTPMTGSDSLNDAHQVTAAPDKAEEEMDDEETEEEEEMDREVFSSASPLPVAAGLGVVPLLPTQQPPPPHPFASSSSSSPLPHPPAQGSGPSRSRVRRPSAGSTLELLLAAAQQTLLETTPAASSSAAASGSGSASGGGGGGGGSWATSLSLPLGFVAERRRVSHDRDYGRALQQPPQPPLQPAQEDSEEEEVRWQQELLRRLRSIHRSDGGDDARVGADRWRERLPPQTTALRRSPYGGGGYRLSASTEADVEGWRVAVYSDEAQAEDTGELPSLSLSGSAVAYEPWRTTVATGTRYAHRPPPHPYSVAGLSTQSPLTDNTNTNTSSSTNTNSNVLRESVYAAGAERTRSAARPQSPLLPSAAARSPTPLLRVPHRPVSCPVPYIDSANSSQIAPPANYVPGYITATTATATTTNTSNSRPHTASPGGGISGAGPQALYLSGRRRSRLPSTPATWAPSPPRSQHLAHNAATAQIARLHENHLHDQYARAAWNAVVAQAQAQERERERLSPPSQSAQVQRLYAEPLQERMNRAAIHARPSAEQLYHFHGCTFTPKINDSRLTQRGGVAGGRLRGTPSGTRNRPVRGANTSSESMRVPSTLPSNNTTMTCDDTTSTSANTQSSTYRRGRRVTPS